MAKKVPGGQRLLDTHGALHKTLPYLSGVFDAEDEFIEFRFKIMDDGTTLGILKRYGSDGGPMVLFASGYGVYGCLLAVDSAVQGNRWRIDKPWSPKKD